MIQMAAAAVMAMHDPSFGAAFHVPLACHNAAAPSRLRSRTDALIIRGLAEGAHDGARMTEIPLMSSLFISTID